MTDSDFSNFKILNYIKGLVLIVCWFIASSNNKSAISELELYPEDEDESDADADDQSDNEANP